MDQGADRIAQDIKDIAQTRDRITDKLAAIEQHVGATMQHARSTMSQLAEKTASSVCEATQATKEALDPAIHAARHPWAFVGGALVLGYAVGALYNRGQRITTGVVPYYPPTAKGAEVMPTRGSTSSIHQEPGVYPFYSDQAPEATGERGQTGRPTIWTELEDTFRDELDLARSGLIRLARGMVRQLVRQTVPVIFHAVASYSRDAAVSPTEPERPMKSSRSRQDVGP